MGYGNVSQNNQCHCNYPSEVSQKELHCYEARDIVNHLCRYAICAIGYQVVHHTHQFILPLALRPPPCLALQCERVLYALRSSPHPLSYVVQWILSHPPWDPAGVFDRQKTGLSPPPFTNLRVDVVVVPSAHELGKSLVDR